MATAPVSAKQSSSPRQTWQERLLPLMVRMLVGLTIFFFVASFSQLLYLHSRIEAAPQIRTEDLLAAPTINSAQANQDKLAEAKLRAEVILESNVVARRYHQANVFLMSRVWTNYLGFVTGMTLALVGATFVLGQLKAPQTEIDGKTEAIEITFRSASPGITLAVLGVVLMMATIIVNHDIETTDTPTYLGNEDLAVQKPNVPSTPPSVH